MDPKACLDRMRDYLEEGNLEYARWQLLDFRRWQRMGGFTTPELVGMADDLQMRLNEAEDEAGE